MARQTTVTAGELPGPEALTSAIRDLVAAVDQARSVGLAVPIPDPLYQACREVVDRYESSAAGDGRGRASRRGERRTLVGDGSAPLSAREVPLRKLIWHVIDPGEDFTVSDVVERLAGLDASAPANRVSNALGYWAAEGRLIRRRKGVYSYLEEPEATVELTHTDTNSQQESPTGPYNRIGSPVRRKDDHVVPGRTREKKAM